MIRNSHQQLVHCCHRLSHCSGGFSSASACRQAEASASCAPHHHLTSTSPITIVMRRHTTVMTSYDNHDFRQHHRYVQTDTIAEATRKRFKLGSKVLILNSSNHLMFLILFIFHPLLFACSDSYPHVHNQHVEVSNGYSHNRRNHTWIQKVEE